jgi:4-amino-4-deoxy-L-arabinose transferase-like glycosyltransferase
MMTPVPKPNQRDYKTRKEYRWARKQAKRQESSETRGWRYLIALVAVGLGFATHSFVVFLVTLLALAVVLGIARAL